MSCTEPAPWQTLVDYLAGDLAEGEEGKLEEHLFRCEECAREAARAAGVTEALRGAIPPLLTTERYVRLVASGLRHLENRMSPGERREQRMPKDLDLLVHRLGGLDLTEVARVSFTLRPEGSERVMVSITDAPYDREGGAVLLACQQHYASLPHDTVAEVRVTDRAGHERVSTYTILHRFE